MKIASNLSRLYEYSTPEKGTPFAPPYEMWLKFDWSFYGNGVSRKKVVLINGVA